MSREIDALVAEKLFGWRWLRHTCMANGSRYWARSLFIPNHGVEPFDGGQGMENVPASGHEPIAVMNAPHYSTDIAAAWEVVEKMREIIPYQKQTQTYSFQLCQTGIPGDWFCSFVTNSGDWSCQPRFEGFVPAPLAICLAALKAVGVEIPEGVKA